MANDDLRQRAWSLHQRGDLSSAEQSYSTLIDQGRQEGALDARDAINLGALLRQQGRLKEAQLHYRQVLDLLPDNTQLRANAINTLIEARALDEALRVSDQGLTRNPHHCLLLECRGRLELARGEHAQALTRFEQVLKQRPDDLQALLGLGQAQDGLQRWNDALRTYEQLTQCHPDDPRGSHNQLLMLQRLGRYNDAQQLYRNLPEDVRLSSAVRAAYAHLVMEQQDTSQAESLYRELCLLEPSNPHHWLNHAASLKALKHTNACTRAVKQGLLREPQNRDLLQSLGQCLAEMGKHPEAISCLLNSAGDLDQINSAYLNNLQFIGASYDLISSEDRQAMARSWEQRQQHGGVGALWGDRIQQSSLNRSLRVGYLSADFNSHPVGRFIEPVLIHHDRAKVDVVGISCGPYSDETTERLREACDEWLNIRHATDLEAARLISDQQLDVLVELGGFTAHNRMGVLTHRPAPVQLSYLGYCGPTYLHCIDGWVGDEALFAGLNTTDRDAHALLMVEGGYMAFIPKDLPPLEPPEPKRNFRFGCFNHARKLTTECIVLFAAVLKACPETELVLKSISFIEVEDQHRIRQKFEAAGLAPERLLIEPWVEGWSNHMSRYGQMDLALDPIPYGGATTSCEALLMGVPVVSLAGPGMVGRLTASILESAGLNQWLAPDTTSFIQVAQSIVSDGPRSLQERKQLRNHIQHSNLCDARRLTTELERIYRDLCNF